MGFRMMVIADSSGNWVSNQLVFATHKEAEDYARDLGSRWTLVQKTRVDETPDAPNYTFENYELKPIKEKEKTDA